MEAKGNDFSCFSCNFPPTTLPPPPPPTPPTPTPTPIDVFVALEDLDTLVLVLMLSLPLLRKGGLLLLLLLVVLIMLSYLLPSSELNIFSDGEILPRLDTLPDLTIPIPPLSPLSPALSPPLALGDVDLALSGWRDDIFIFPDLPLI